MYIENKTKELKSMLTTKQKQAIRDEVSNFTDTVLFYLQEYGNPYNYDEVKKEFCKQFNCICDKLTEELKNDTEEEF